MNITLVAIVLFVLAYVIIISEKIHRTVVAMVGGALMVVLGVLTQERAIEAIDFNTLGLLIGMMIMVHLLSKTGLFQYLGVVVAKKAKGSPLKILFAMSLLTAVASALLDNVTTVLLLTPILFIISDRLEISPIPFLFAEIMAANIGGTATLIGDPPNIIIGSAAGFTFLDFIVYVAPAVLVIFAVNATIVHFMYKKRLAMNGLDAEKVFADINPKESLVDIPLLKKSLVVMSLVIVGFLLHGVFHIEPATIALFGAGLLLLITNLDPAHSLEAVEWNVIFFFVGLFILVGGLEHVGVIHWLADKLLEITKGNQSFAVMLILWGSGIFSSIVDNIPFVATMAPLLNELQASAGREFVFPIWWALSLGACLGGNGTLVGASANLVVAGLAEKQANTKISFIGYLKVAFPLMIVSLLVATGYMYLRFLI